MSKTLRLMPYLSGGGGGIHGFLIHHIKRHTHFSLLCFDAVLNRRNKRGVTRMATVTKKIAWVDYLLILPVGVYAGVHAIDD